MQNGYKPTSIVYSVKGSRSRRGIEVTFLLTTTILGPGSAGKGVVVVVVAVVGSKLDSSIVDMVLVTLVSYMIASFTSLLFRLERKTTKL